MKYKTLQFNSALFITSFALLLLSACGDKSSQSQNAPVATPAPAPSDTATTQTTAPTSTTPVAAPATGEEEKVLNFYNWPDYISKDMLANFEKETGIKVNYQNFENNEGLHAKLVAGSTGYDIVVPGAVFAKSQIDAGLFAKLERTMIPNLSNLDPAIMQKIESVDSKNEHLVPWAWSFTTVAINKGKVTKALGNMPLPENAWDLVFNPTYTSKLKACGIAFLDSATEIMPPALHYIGKNAYSNDVADHKAAGEMLAKVRPDIRIFSSTMIDDIASGKACVGLGWAGDFNIARTRTKENKTGQEIQTLLPSTGGIIFFDLMAIPKDAKHPKNAHIFMNYFLKPEVSASLTNELGYATANKASLTHIKPELAQDPTIFTDAENMTKMVSPSSFNNEARTSLNNVYTLFKKGK